MQLAESVYCTSETNTFLMNCAPNKPESTVAKNPTNNAGDMVWISGQEDPWSKKRQPPSIFAGIFHEQSCLVTGPWG